MAEHQLPKLNTRVRFPSSAPFLAHYLGRLLGQDEVVDDQDRVALIAAERGLERRPSPRLIRCAALQRSITQPRLRAQANTLALGEQIQTEAAVRYPELLYVPWALPEMPSVIVISEIEAVVAS